MVKQRENTILHKVRIKQTRYFALLFLPLILLNGPAYGDLAILMLGWLGLCCLIICAFGRAFASVYIGGRKNEVLVRYGIFSVVRNPLYVFSFFGTVGLGLLCHSIVITALLAGVYVFYYQMIVSKEERFLTQKFADSYRDYMRDVPRWIPNLSKWQGTDLIETKPAFVFSTLRDAAAFFAIVPVTQFVDWLHIHAILPILFRLP